MPYAEHTVGQDFVPMRHQIEIGSIVAGDVGDAIGEFLPLREELFQVAHAAGHRLPPRIDDPRVGKHQVNKPDMAEIIGHLVDETRPAGAVRFRVAEVFFRKAGEDVGRQVGQNAGISRIVQIRVTPLEVKHDARDVRKFLRAFDLGMRRQDLLEQRRP